MKKKTLPKLIVILGPTASGKTSLAIKLAKKFNGEIISADSRQIYKEMEVGTAKPSKKEMETVPHYLVGIIKPNQDFNVVLYKKMVFKAIKNIQKRKKMPFLVGGTGLYIKAVVDNIEFPKVPAQKKLRKGLEAKTEKRLFEIYKKLDPEGAKFIDRKNKRRLIRAIEVCKATKKPFWEQRKKGEVVFDILQIGIKLPKNELKKRIDKRIDKMFKSGLGKEVKNLVKKYSWNIPALRTIGYQEWSPFIRTTDNKKTRTSLQKEKKEIKEKVKLHTIQFAKRQITWFKINKKIFWIKDYKKAEKLVKKFLQK